MSKIEGPRANSGVVAAIISFFSTRLFGTAPVAEVFWHDTIFIGSCVLFASLALTVALALHDAPTALLVAAYLANWPYSMFAVVAVWRATEKPGLPYREVRPVGPHWPGWSLRSSFEVHSRLALVSGSVRPQ